MNKISRRRHRRGFRAKVSRDGRLSVKKHNVTLSDELI